MPSNLLNENAIQQAGAKLTPMAQGVSGAAPRPGQHRQQYQQCILSGKPVWYHNTMPTKQGTMPRRGRGLQQMVGRTQTTGWWPLEGALAELLHLRKGGRGREPMQGDPTHHQV